MFDAFLKNFSLVKTVGLRLCVGWNLFSLVSIVSP